ncbi:ferric reductase-like transmembrane domain-containing protein [Streptomyces narbonensis]
MARVPAVEHGVGADRLARWHSLGGRHVLGLIAAHALLALCGYAVHTHTDLVTATGDLLSYGAIAAATAGTALLAAIGVTSARSVRRRVRHETWRAVHLSGLLAAALGFVHQLAGPDVAGSLLTVWLWSMAHATVGVLLVWDRIVVPVRAALRHELRVAEVRDEGPGVVSVLVQGRGVARLRAEPGQFFRWRFLRRGLWATALPLPGARPRRHPADHRQGARRPHPPDPAPAPRDAGPRLRPLRRAHRPPPHPPQGPAARGRRRHHPAARPLRDPARRPRRHHSPLSGLRRGRPRPARGAGGHRPRTPGRPRSSSAPRTAPTTPSRRAPCASSYRTSPPMTCTCAARPRWPGPRLTPWAGPGCPPPVSTARTSTMVSAAPARRPAHEPARRSADAERRPTADAARRPPAKSRSGAASPPPSWASGRSPRPCSPPPSPHPPRPRPTANRGPQAQSLLDDHGLMDGATIVSLGSRPCPRSR